MSEPSPRPELLDVRALRVIDKLPPQAGAATLFLFYALRDWCIRHRTNTFPRVVLADAGRRLRLSDAQVENARETLLRCGFFSIIDNLGIHLADKVVEDTAPPAPPAAPPRQLPEARTGFVYFVEVVMSGGLGDIKIGFATNVADRVATLQTGCPLELRVLAAVPGIRGLLRLNLAAATRARAFG